MIGDNNENSNSSINNTDQVTQAPEQVYEEILFEIENQKTQQKSWLTNVLILVFSLLIFFQLGLFEFGLNGVFMIIVVLFIHETGHLLGMRMFGYRNVQMFFIPFFGAAVSGESRNVAAYKEAIVSLLGPLPGIIIGCTLMIMFAATGQEDYIKSANMFLFINIFNLLPFYPLDGGRFLYIVLFSRSRYLELCFRIFAALALILVGYALSAWLLALLGLINLWGVRIPFKLTKAAKEVCQSQMIRDSPVGIDNAGLGSEIPPLSIAKIIIDKTYEYFPPPLNISIIARYTKQIWERITFRPGGIFSTVALLIIYLLAFCIPLAALIGSVIVSSMERTGFLDTKLVEYQRPDGSKGLKEQVYFHGKLDLETEVDPQTYLYHGREIGYFDANTISWEGVWSHGRHNGEWKAYNKQEELIQVTVYDKGNFVSRKVKVDNQWVEKKLEDLPFILKWRLRREQKKPSGPAAKQR